MITSNKIRLREKRLSDAQDDYEWRSDPELAYLDAAPLITITFQTYLADYTSMLKYRFLNRHRFAIDTLDGKHIGNCGYYGIDETKGEAELGIMIGNRKYWDKNYGTEAVSTLVNYIFSRTKLNRIYLKTLESNGRAQRCFQKCGFTTYDHVTRDKYNFVLMELHREQWQEQQGGEPDK